MKHNIKLFLGLLVGFGILFSSSTFAKPATANNILLNNKTIEKQKPVTKTKVKTPNKKQPNSKATTKSNVVKQKPAKTTKNKTGSKKKTTGTTPKTQSKSELNAKQKPVKTKVTPK